MSEREQGYQAQDEPSDDQKAYIRTTLQFVVLGCTPIFGRDEIVQRISQFEEGLTLGQISDSIISELAQKHGVSVEIMSGRLGGTITDEIRHLERSGMIIQRQNTREGDTPILQFSPYAREYWNSIKDDLDKAASESIFPFITLTHFLK